MAATNKEEQQLLKFSFSRICLNFMAWFGGVVYHFSWVIIHNIKPNHVDYYHIEGFWDCSMYVRNKYGVKIYTWVETPCSCRKFVFSSTEW